MAICLLLTLNCSAQPVLVNGGPQMAGVDGSLYKKTTTLGTGGYYNCVSASRDGSRFYAVKNEKLYFIHSSDYSIVDSMNVPLYEIVSSNEYDVLFGRSSGAVYRINTNTRTVVDSIVLPNPWRLQERPGSKELWLSSDSMIYVINYSSGLAATSFKAGKSQYDNGDIRFTMHGSVAYKGCPFTKKVYKIDATAKTIVDSVASSGFIEVSQDSSRLFISSGNTIYVHSTANMSLTDSMVCARTVFMMFRHPSRQEIWAVNHFDDSITVFNPATLALIDSFGVTGSPHYVAFASGATSISDIGNPLETSLYPNPAGNVLNVTLSATPCTVSIYDQVGKLIMTDVANNNKLLIDIKALIPGLYYVETRSQNNVTSLQRFSKL